DGTVVAWGCGFSLNSSDLGQCTVPAGLSGVTAIGASLTSSEALKSDGTEVGWGCGGDNDVGQCTAPAGLGGVTAISAGPYHNLAVVGPRVITSATVTLGNLSQQYDGTARAASATVNPPSCGPVTLQYSQGGTPVSAPTNAGSYDVQANLSGTDC